jgi:Omp85 superfamily domain
VWLEDSRTLQNQQDTTGTAETARGFPSDKMRRLLAALFLLAALSVAAIPANAFSLLSPQTWPPAFDPHNWPFTLIPVPEVATNPNGGVTYGVLFATLFKGANGDIRYIFAPDINNNTDLGAGGTARFLSYPSADTQWYAVAGAQQNIARTVDLNYATGRTHEDWWSFEGRLFFERDPTERFFGIGNNSSEGNQTNYTTEQVYVRALFGWNITRHLQLAALIRPRYLRIQEGAFTPPIPQIGTLFPRVKGINGGSEIYNEIRLTYDTRDSIDIPRAGGLAVIYYGLADRRFMSSVSYNRFGGALHRYYSIGKRVTLAGHAYIQYIPAGVETPFWAMGRLGGEESLLYDQQTLRGYGAGRFVDNNLAVFNFEVRTRVYEANLFSYDGIAEIAPFFEAGRVWHGMSANPVSDLHPVGGIGFRAVVEPFVVAYVDVGRGGEGTAVFSGINYPF